MLLLCFGSVCSLTYTIYLPPFLLPTRPKSKAPISEFRASTTWPNYCCRGVVVYAHKNLLSFQAEYSPPPNTASSLSSLLLAHPAPTLTRCGASLCISSIALQHLSIWTSLRYSWPVIQALGVFKSRTDLWITWPKWIDQVQERVKWFIQVYAAGGSQS